MSTFADSLVSQLSAPVSAPAAEAPATPAAPASSEVSTPASTPESPASPTAPTPAETPANPEIPTATEDEFEWPDPNAPQPADTQKPAEGTPETPQPEATTDDPNTWKAEDIEKLLPQQVIDKLLTTQKGRNIYQSYKMVRELSKPLGEGGLGFTPTVEQVRDMHQAANDLEIMAHELHNPSTVAQNGETYGSNFIRNVFQVGPNGQPAPHALTLAGQMAATLDTHSPDLYRAAALPFVQNYVEELYRQAENEADPEQRVVRFNVARIIEQDISGKARDIAEEVWKGAAKPQQQTDPRAAEVEQKWKAVQDFEKRQQTEAQQRFNGALENAKRQVVIQDLRFALKPSMDAYKNPTDGKISPTYWAIERAAYGEAMQLINQNPAALRNYVIARDRAAASPSPETIQAAAQAYRAAVRPVLAQIRSKYNQDTLNRKVQESNQRHQVLQEASQKRGSTSIGQPTEKNAQPKIAAQPGEDFRDVVRRALTGIQGAA